MEVNSKLDEKGFVFLDQSSRPYWIRMWENEPWMFYWHKHQQSWVSLRSVTQLDIWKAAPNKLTDEEAEVYHNTHKEFENKCLPK